MIRSLSDFTFLRAGTHSTVDRPAEAPDPHRRQIALRGDRGTAAGVLQPGQRIDPLGYAAGASPCSLVRRIIARPTTRFRSGRVTCFPKRNAPKAVITRVGITSPPKDPAASLRQNKQDLIDMKDRRACLTKPAGTAAGSGGGYGGSTVAQSGISKQLDAAAGHKLLGSIAKSLARAERLLAEYAILVLRGSARRPSKIERGSESCFIPLVSSSSGMLRN